MGIYGSGEPNPRVCLCGRTWKNKQALRAHLQACPPWLALPRWRCAACAQRVLSGELEPIEPCGKCGVRAWEPVE